MEYENLIALREFPDTQEFAWEWLYACFLQRQHKYFYVGYPSLPRHNKARLKEVLERYFSKKTTEKVLEKLKTTPIRKWSGEVLHLYGENRLIPTDKGTFHFNTGVFIWD